MLIAQREIKIIRSARTLHGLCEKHEKFGDKSAKGHKTKKPQISLRLSAVRTGLEPATSAVTGRHSNQLNYRSNLRVVHRHGNPWDGAFFGMAKIGEF